MLLVVCNWMAYCGSGEPSARISAYDARGPRSRWRAVRPDPLSPHSCTSGEPAGTYNFSNVEHQRIWQIDGGDVDTWAVYCCCGGTWLCTLLWHLGTG